VRQLHESSNGVRSGATATGRGWRNARCEAGLADGGRQAQQPARPGRRRRGHRQPGDGAANRAGEHRGGGGAASAPSATARGHAARPAAEPTAGDRRLGATVRSAI
jgi:hypothetical protein